MKMLLDRCGRTLLLGIAGLALSRVAVAQEEKKGLLQSVDLIQEIFFISTPANSGMTFRSSWTELSLRANDRWSAKTTGYFLPTRSLLDETYLQFEDPARVIRVGRLRSLFGFGRWSDMFYNVVIRSPMVRMMPMLDRFSLLNATSGFEWHEYRNGLEFSIQGGDAQLSDRQLVGESQNVTVGRVQGTVSTTLLGVNVASVKSTSGFGSGGQVFGLDFKAFADRTTIRGELLGSRGSGLTSKGYYADISYRPPGNHRLQLGVRLEEYAMGSTAARMFTAGARYVPLPWLSMNLNYGWTPSFGLLNGDAGSTPAPFMRAYPDTLKGWSLQTMFAYRFRS